MRGRMISMSDEAIQVTEMTPIKKREPFPAEQAAFAVPAFMYIIMPVVDMVQSLYAIKTGGYHWDVFGFIPKLPLFLLLFVVIDFGSKVAEKKSLKAVTGDILARTKTFQSTLLIFMMFLGLTLMSIAVNGFTDYALHGHYYTQMSMWTYIGNICLYFFVSSLVSDKRVKSFLVGTCVAGACVYSVFAIWLLRISGNTKAGMTGSFYNRNHFGYYAAVACGLACALFVAKIPEFRKGIRGKLLVILLGGAAFLLSYTLAVVNTLGAWIAVLFVHFFLFVVYKIKDGKWNFHVLISLGVFVLATLFASIWHKALFTSILKTIFDLKNILEGADDADKAGSGRWLIWKLTVRHIIDRPLFGNGIEGLLAKITLEGSSTGSPHNEYLEYMGFFGVPAGLAYISGCVSVFLHGQKYKKELNAVTLVCLAGAFAYLVSAFFGVCFYYTCTYPFIFLGLGLNFAAEDQPAVPVIAALEGDAAEGDAAEAVVPEEKTPEGEEPLEEAHDDVAEADETEKTEE